jgi:hypothetical protein
MWGHAALFHLQQRQLPDAVAAAQMSRETHVCRLDPLFRSLATARLAAVQAGVGERTAAIRALGQAETAYNRADKSPAAGLRRLLRRSRVRGPERHRDDETRQKRGILRSSAPSPGWAAAPLPPQPRLLLGAPGHHTATAGSRGRGLHHSSEGSCRRSRRPSGENAISVRALRPRTHHEGGRNPVRRPVG